MLVIFDTETCGVDASSPIVELASITRHNGQCLEFSSLANPGRPIPPEASRVHGIYDHHVAQAEPAHKVANGWWDWVSSTYFEDTGDAPLVLAGHNIGFDIGILAKYIGDTAGLHFTRPLCTLRLARRLHPDAVTHKLTDIAALEQIDLADIKAHSALDDCKMVARLLALWQHRTDKNYYQLADELASPIMLEVMPFGKFKGLPISQVPNNYMVYLLELPRLDTDVRYTFERVLGRRA